MKLFFGLLLACVALALGILFMSGLGRIEPLQPVVAVIFGLLLLFAGLWTFRAIGRGSPPPDREGPEDVTELEVFFVCDECGTEFKVERIGELQVPRHCGERMRVERRPGVRS